MQKEILKVRFNVVSEDEVIKKIMDWLNGAKQRFICTPNPEILLEAKKNLRFRNVLNSSDLNIPDGIGILWAAKFMEISKNDKNFFLRLIKWKYSLLAILFRPNYIKNPIKERVTGADLMKKICKKFQGEVFLLGALEGIAEKAQEKLLKNNPKLKIVGTYAGTSNKEDESEIIEKINQAKPKILFVAYGAPHQEFWIHRNLHKIPSVKIAIGVGGSFDFIAGVKKRSPKWMQKWGLEWLYRLIQEPKRIKRIYNATIKFPLTILYDRNKK